MDRIGVGPAPGRAAGPRALGRLVPPGREAVRRREAARRPLGLRVPFGEGESQKGDAKAKKATRILSNFRVPFSGHFQPAVAVAT